MHGNGVQTDTLGLSAQLDVTTYAFTCSTRTPNLNVSAPNHGATPHDVESCEH